MDEMCMWLERVARWVSHAPVLPIDYVGLGYEQIRNPPLPLLEVLFAVEGAFDEMIVGTRRVSVPHHHVSLHSVQFGNRGVGSPDARCWCLFLDIGDIPEFQPFLRQPLFWCHAVQDAGRLAEAFQRLTIRCRMPPCSVTRDPYHMAGADRPGRFCSWLVKAALLEVIGCLLAELGADTTRADMDQEPLAVRRAREFMAAHLQEATLGAADIAAASCLSRAQLTRVFRACTGLTPCRYLRSMRMSQAQFLLERTSGRVKDIAREVGFHDPLHFSRVFRGALGMGPRTYRERHRFRG
jgi:AraC-like DNA-binding protein